MTSDQEFLAQFKVGFVARWIGFTAACIAMFMAILDIQVVVTALHVIEEDLGIGADRMSWIQTAYIIAEVVAIPLTGLLMRVFSMRWLFVLALSGFTLASAGCAMSGSFTSLLVWRVLQGFAGGVLIPIVFSSIFLLFPKGWQQTMATTLGGLLAVLAPALGPLIGGWLTENSNIIGNSLGHILAFVAPMSGPTTGAWLGQAFTWQWVFLINVIPGILSVLAGALTLPKSRINFGVLQELDWLALVAFAVCLALLIIGLKEAPNRGWLSPVVLGLLAASATCLYFTVSRPASPILFKLLHDRALAYGCALSFLLGFALFSAVYILPVFLAFVKGHGPYQIGVITLVMGISQIIAAPLIVQVDRFVNARILAALGFALFGVGLLMNASLTTESDYDEVFWPQVFRGAAIALCILPPIRMALSLLPMQNVNDASGLFNLVRNIGGAIGIAVMDSIMFGRSPIHSDRLMDMLKTNPEGAALALGIPVDEIPAPDDPTEMMNILDLVQAASLTQAINEAWFVLAIASFAALPVLWFVGPIRSAIPAHKLNQTAENTQK